MDNKEINTIFDLSGIDMRLNLYLNECGIDMRFNLSLDELSFIYDKDKQELTIEEIKKRIHNAVNHIECAQTLWSWNRSESRSDYRHLETLIGSIHEEMKDFHERLLIIEKERK